MEGLTLTVVVAAAAMFISYKIGFSIGVGKGHSAGVYSATDQFLYWSVMAGHTYKPETEVLVGNIGKGKAVFDKYIATVGYMKYSTDDINQGKEIINRKIAEYSRQKSEQAA